MKKFVVFFILPLFLSNCNKSISYGGKDMWQRQQQKDYDSSVFYQQNQNNNNYNNQNNNYNNQRNNNNGQDVNNQQYNENNNNNNENNNRQSNNSGNNMQPVNIYITNPGQQYGNVRNSQLEDAINKAENGGGIKSALLEQGKQSGQVDLAPREQFTNEKQKVKYSIEPKIEKQQQTFQETQEKQIMQEIKKETAKQINTTSKGYKIQCGNYASKTSADAIAKKIREAGIEDVNVISENGSNRILVGNFASKNDGAEVFSKINELNLKDSIFWSYR